MEELLARHKQEQKALDGKVMALKKAVPKGDKKKKKAAQEQADQLQAELTARHKAEVAALQKAGAGADPAAVPAPEEPAASAQPATGADDEDDQDPPAGGQGGKRSKAAKRREAKEREAKERAERIQQGQVAEGESKQELEDAAIDSKLKPLGLRRQQVKPDGHCMFRAIEIQLPADKAKSVSELRKAAVAHLRARQDDFLPFMTQDNGDMMTPEAFEEYCSKMENTAAWGGPCELRALSELLDVQIQTYQADAPVQTIGPDEADQEDIIRLSYHRHQFGLGEHYNAVVPSQ